MIAIDKELTKMVLVPHGIRMPAGRIVESESLYEGDPLPRPYVLKPVNEGSSVGVAIVTRRRQLRRSDRARRRGAVAGVRAAARRALHPGRELTVAVLGDEALAVTELRPKSGFYDYDAKYTDGMTEHVCPADIPDEIATRRCAMALDAHRLLGCKGASRSDFRWDDEQGEAGLYLLEVNTQPGMTPLSLVPEQARHAGHRLCRAGRADRGGGVMSGADRPRRAGARPRRRRAAGSRAAPARASRRSRALLESLGFAPGCGAADRQLDCWPAMTVAVVVAAVLAFRLPQLAGIAIGEGVGGAGFTLRRVEITRQSTGSRRSTIYNVAFDQDSMAMPLVDLDAHPRAAARSSAGSARRGSRAGCPTRWSSTSSSAQPAAIWQNQRAAEPDRRRRRRARAGAGRGDARSAAG